MPIHIQPVIRARELALENVGLIKIINSDGLNVQRNLEAAGIIPIVIPVGRVTVFGNTAFDPNTTTNKTKW